DLKIGTITDTDGKFTLPLSEDIQTLSISYTGYETQETAVTGRTYIDVQLRPSTTELEELLVVGYGTQARSDVSGSIAQIKEETIENTPVVSLEEALQGQAAGLFISSKTGKLGSKLNVNIRGITSINAGSEPLYVVDGVLVNSQEQMLSSSPLINPLSNLDLNDVASVEILKDASAAAIYGSRASNGVIIINTKQGQAGKTRIELDIQKGWSAPTRKREWLNAEQYLELWDEAFNNVAAPDGTVRGWTAEDWKNNFLPEWDQGHDTNWEEVMYNENAGLQRVSLNISGGNKSTKFYISGGYQDQVGTIVTDELRRISTRINLDHQVSSMLGIGVNLSLSRNINPYLASDNSFFNPGQIIAIPPVQPLFDPKNQEELFTNTLYPNAKLGEQEVEAKDIQHRSLGK
ncbi:MAG: TonB-dependent receptor plug domain-containing protein, partial [Bacteroidota bacterium]